MAVKITVKAPKIVIKDPTRKFWHRLGEDNATTIDKRTLSGVDVNRKMFKRYSEGYKKSRQENSLSTRPNLSFSNRMLTALGRGVRSSKKGFKIILSGTEGFKAWANEQSGRDFFGLGRREKDKILKQVTLFYTVKNKLKKR